MELVFIDYVMAKCGEEDLAVLTSRYRELERWLIAPFKLQVACLSRGTAIPTRLSYKLVSKFKPGGILRPNVCRQDLHTQPRCSLMRDVQREVCNIVPEHITGLSGDSKAGGKAMFVCGHTPSLVARTFFLRIRSRSIVNCRDHRGQGCRIGECTTGRVSQYRHLLLSTETTLCMRKSSPAACAQR